MDNPNNPAPPSQEPTPAPATPPPAEPTPGVGNPTGSPDVAAIFGSKPTNHQAVTGQPPPSGDTPPPTEPAPSTPPAEPPPATPPAQPATPPPPPPYVPPVDPQAIANQAAQAALAAQQQQQQAQPPQLSQEEFNRKYNIPQVTEQNMAAVLGDDPKVAAETLQGMLISAARSGALMGQQLAEQKVNALQQQFQPSIDQFQAVHQERQEAALRDEFKTQFPDLKDEDAVLDEIQAAIKSRGWQASPQAQGNPAAIKQELFNFVAGRARDILKRVAPPQGAPPPATPPPNTPPRPMAPSAMGGRTGTAPAAPKNDIESIFG